MAKEPRQPKQYDDDDGRTIVDMNVEGMPYYQAGVRKEERAKKRAELNEKIASGEALNRRETIRYTIFSMLGGLAVLGIVGGALILFIVLLMLWWKIV